MENNLERQILNREFNQRKLKNSSYSIRAFARDLGLGSTTLSDVLAGKRTLSKKNLEKTAKILSLSPVELELISNYKKKSNIQEEVQRLQIEEDEFQLIAKWYHLAILSLAKINQSPACADWVAQRLGITKEEATRAIEALLRLGFLSTDDGVLKRTSAPLSTTRDIPSHAIKNYHKSVLELAGESLYKDSIDKREFSSVTMAIDPKKLPEAKEILMKAKRKISKLLESNQPKEVYQLSFQLFPLTKDQGDLLQ